MANAPYKYSTLAVHAGQYPDPLTGAVNVPVYLSSTFELTGIGTDRGWDYSRAGNPTRDRLEEALAALEGGVSAHAFTTGMAAISALTAMLRAGDHLICSKDVYAGTVRLLDRIVSGYGIEIEYVDTSDLAAVEAAVKSNTKLVHIETPSNPLMVLTDIAAVSEIAHAKGAEVSVDNTFLSPALQSPLALGADIVMHSTTKYLNGHSDGLGGALIGSTPEHKERFLLVQKAAGSARHQDAAAQDQAARREWPRRGGVPLHASQGQQAGLSGPEEPSAVRSGREAAKGLWLHDELRGRVARGGGALPQGDQDLPERRVAGRS